MAIGRRNSLMRCGQCQLIRIHPSPLSDYGTSVSARSRSETADTVNGARVPRSCLTKPVLALLTVENRFVELSEKIDRVIDRANDGCLTLYRGSCTLTVVASAVYARS